MFNRVISSYNQGVTVVFYLKFERMCVCVCMYVYACACMYAYACACMHAYACACMHIFRYTEYLHMSLNILAHKYNLCTRHTDTYIISWTMLKQTPIFYQLPYFQLLSHCITAHIQCQARVKQTKVSLPPLKQTLNPILAIAIQDIPLLSLASCCYFLHKVHLMSLVTLK